MSLNSQTVVLPRREENLVAIVKFNSRGEEKDGMKNIVQGITNWVKHTEEGKAAWRYTVGDLNIGDLDSYLDPRHNVLYQYLNKQGIYNLDIHIIGTGDYARDYHYDTILVDELQLDEE